MEVEARQNYHTYQQHALHQRQHLSCRNVIYNLFHEPFASNSCFGDLPDIFVRRISMKTLAITGLPVGVVKLQTRYGIVRRQ